MVRVFFARVRIGLQAARARMAAGLTAGVTIAGVTITGVTIAAALGVTAGLTAAPAQAQAPSCQRPSEACRAHLDPVCLNQQGYRESGPAATPACDATLDALRLCLAEYVRTCGPGSEWAHPMDAPTAVAGTVWTGETGDGSPYTMRFCPTGVVDYDSKTGRWDTGRWVRIGPELVISMNDGFAIYFGHVDDAGYSGRFINVNNARTTFDFPRDRRTFDGRCGPV